MKLFISNIKKYYKYALRSAKSELKSEVADSYLNWLWWVLEPLVFMLIYTFVFGFIFKNDQKYFASFVFVGLTLWQFFNRMLSGSVKLITNNRDLVTKVYIPKYILLLSKSFTYLFKMGISFALAFILMLCQKVPLSFNILLIVPIVIILYLFSFGISMLLMHYGVLFDDLNNITNLALKLIFYLSGVFYNINVRLSGALRYLLLRGNPVAFLMSEARKVMLYNKMPSFEGLLFYLGLSIVFCLLGIYVIHKNENSYAKVI